MNGVSSREDAVYTSVAQQQVHNRIVQKYKYNFTYHIDAIVAASTTAPQNLTITQDADFQWEKITGRAFGPVDDNGIPQQSNTDFPMPGIAIGQGFAGRGLQMQITDQGAARPLTDGFIPVELLLTPGYGVQMFLPYPIKYFSRRNSVLQFDFRNQDTQAQQAIDIAINGYKFEMPEIRDTLQPNEQLARGAVVV